MYKYIQLDKWEKVGLYILNLLIFFEHIPEDKRGFHLNILCEHVHLINLIFKLSLLLIHINVTLNTIILINWAALNTFSSVSQHLESSFMLLDSLLFINCSRHVFLHVVIKYHCFHSNKKYKRNKVTLKLVYDKFSP